MEETSGLTKDAILAKIAERKASGTVAVPVPEWDGTVYIRRLSMTQMEADGFLDAARDRNAIVNRLLVATLADESGEPLFAPEDMPGLIEGEASVLMRLFNRSAALNGLSETATEAEAEVFDGAQDDATDSE